MTTPLDLPPVGATVVLPTTFGGRWTRDADGWMSDGGLDLPDYDTWCACLDLAWRMQQERDQLRRVAELRGNLDPILSSAARRRDAYNQCVPAVSGFPKPDLPRNWAGETPLEVATRELLGLCARAVQEVTP